MDYINIREKETHDYMKNAIDNCATEMMLKMTNYEEQITNYEERMSTKIKELENNFKSSFLKINILEDSLCTFNTYQEKIYKKIQDDIIEQQDFKKKQEIINKNNDKTNDKKLKEYKKLLDENSMFKERVNDSITVLQSSIENIEQHIKTNKVNVKKITSLENEVKKLTLKLNSVEESSNDSSQNEEINSIIQKYLKDNKDDINKRILNIIRSNDIKYDEFNTKFRQLINEVDIIRDIRNAEPAFAPSIVQDLEEVNRKIESIDKKLSNIDITKLSKDIEIKMKNSEKEHIENEIKDNIRLLKDDISNKIQNIEVTYNALINKNYQDRLSNMEQQMICQMTNIHNMLNRITHFEFSSPRLYSESQ
tara:strand:+ start:546 stop:1640 length:1095 start_codon:yes stop_codon:yes gene_type:complete